MVSLVRCPYCIGIIRSICFSGWYVHVYSSVQNLFLPRWSIGCNTCVNVPSARISKRNAPGIVSGVATFLNSNSLRFSEWVCFQIPVNFSCTCFSDNWSTGIPCAMPSLFIENNRIKNPKTRHSCILFLLLPTADFFHFVRSNIPTVIQCIIVDETNNIPYIFADFPCMYIVSDEPREQEIYLYIFAWLLLTHQQAKPKHAQNLFVSDFPQGYMCGELFFIKHS